MKELTKTSQRQLKGLFLIIFAWQYFSLKHDLQTPFYRPEKYFKTSLKKGVFQATWEDVFWRRKDAFVFAGKFLIVLKSPKLCNFFLCFSWTSGSILSLLIVNTVIKWIKSTTLNIATISFLKTLNSFYFQKHILIFY